MTDGEQGIESVATDAGARVGAILEEAESDGRKLNEEAERDAVAARRDAEAEAERIMAEARHEAVKAARERAVRLAEVQAALVSRGPAVLEGLEGAGLTRARLEALIESLAASAERIVREAADGDPGELPAAALPVEPEVEAPEVESPEPEPDADSEPESADHDVEDGSASGNGNGSVRFDGELPDGAPVARMPERSKERDARFAALLLAVQGRDRRDVEAHLRSEYGFADCEPILDEVFGPTPA